LRKSTDAPLSHNRNISVMIRTLPLPRSHLNEQAGSLIIGVCPQPCADELGIF
jgi:hypothetical protein